MPCLKQTLAGRNAAWGLDVDEREGRRGQDGDGSPTFIKELCLFNVQSGAIV